MPGIAPFGQKGTKLKFKNRYYRQKQIVGRYSRGPLDYAPVGLANLGFAQLGHHIGVENVIHDRSGTRSLMLIRGGSKSKYSSAGTPSSSTIFFFFSPVSFR